MNAPPGSRLDHDDIAEELATIAGGSWYAMPTDERDVCREQARHIIAWLRDRGDLADSDRGDVTEAYREGYRAGEKHGVTEGWRAACDRIMLGLSRSMPAVSIAERGALGRVMNRVGALRNRGPEPEPEPEGKDE